MVLLATAKAGRASEMGSAYTITGCGSEHELVSWSNLEVFSACHLTGRETDDDFSMCSNLLPEVEVSFDGTVGMIDSVFLVMDFLDGSFFPN